MKKILVLLVSVLILAGCNRSLSKTPVSPTPDIDSIVVKTAVSKAMAVQPTPGPRLAQNAPPFLTPEVVNPTKEPVVDVSINQDCPTEREFYEELTGVKADIDRTEICSFHWRGDPKTILVEHPCPVGWICTLGTSGQTYVYAGDNSLDPIEIFAGTWRLVDQYPDDDAVHDKCTFLRKVQLEGQISDWKWTAQAGNFSCP